MLVPPQAIQNSLGPRIRSGGRLRMSRTVSAPITIWAPTRTAPTARGRQSRCFRRRFLAIIIKTDNMPFVPGTRADLVLHPVRLRLLQAFLGGRRLTAGQLARELPDVAQAGLYRHLRRLVDGEVLTVVAERQTRGAVERTYALRQDNGWVGPQDLPPLDREAQSKAFATFAAVVMAAYDAYLAAGPRDLARDGVSYSMNAFWLSDEEHLEFLRDLSDVIAPRAGNAPGGRRRRRLGASAFFPAPSPGDG